MIHQPKLIVGVGFPRPIDFDRAGRLTAWSVTQVRRDTAIFTFEFFDRIERRVPLKKPIVEFNPPPGINIRGKPEPASS
jgi:hypothetical protein